MRRVVLLGVWVVLVVAGPAWAQGIASLADLEARPTLTDAERQRIRAWLGSRVASLVVARDASARRMVAARREILAAGRMDPTRSPAYVQAFGEEAVAMLKVASEQAVSQEARVNVVMTVAMLRRLEGIPILLAVLTDDPYAAARYWAARGVSLVAPRVVDRVMPRTEQEIAEAAAKVFETETDALTLYYLFETLGRFDHEAAHDALAEGVTKVVKRVRASKPTGAHALGQAVRALQKAYSGDVRPEAKERILSAYAMLCAWIMPPVANPNLMPALNASLEQITGEKVGFASGHDAVMQKLALLEWVEKFVREKRIPRRPPLPPAVEKVVAKAGG